MTDQDRSLLAMFQDWQQALGRLESAKKTMIAAEADALKQEARFKGAAELIYGIDWTYEYKDGALKFIPPALARKQAIERAKNQKRK